MAPIITSRYVTLDTSFFCKRKPCNHDCRKILIPVELNRDQQCTLSDTVYDSSLAHGCAIWGTMHADRDAQIEIALIAIPPIYVVTRVQQHLIRIKSNTGVSHSALLIAIELDQD